MSKTWKRVELSTQGKVPLIAGTGSALPVSVDYDERQGRVEREHIIHRFRPRYNWELIEQNMTLVSKTSRHATYLCKDSRPLSRDDFYDRNGKEVHPSFEELLNTVRQAIECSVETMAITRIEIHEAPRNLNYQYFERILQQQVRVFLDPSKYQTTSNDLEELNENNSVRFTLDITAGTATLSGSAVVESKVRESLRDGVESVLKHTPRRATKNLARETFPNQTVLCAFSTGPEDMKLGGASPTLVPDPIPTFAVLSDKFQREGLYGLESAPVTKGITIAHLLPGERLWVDVACTKRAGGWDVPGANARFIPGIATLTTCYEIDTSRVRSPARISKIIRDCPARVFKDVEDLGELHIRDSTACTACGECTKKTVDETEFCVVRNRTTGDILTEFQKPVEVKEYGYKDDFAWNREMYLRIDTYTPSHDTASSAATGLTPEWILQEAFRFLKTNRRVSRPEEEEEAGGQTLLTETQLESIIGMLNSIQVPTTTTTSSAS